MDGLAPGACWGGVLLVHADFARQASSVPPPAVKMGAAKAFVIDADAAVTIALANVLAMDELRASAGA
jgi:hypothetical protein